MATPPIDVFVPWQHHQLMYLCHGNTTNCCTLQNCSYIFIRTEYFWLAKVSQCLAMATDGTSELPEDLQSIQLFSQALKKTNLTRYYPSFHQLHLGYFRHCYNDQDSLLMEAIISCQIICHSIISPIQFAFSDKMYGTTEGIPHTLAKLAICYCG